MARIDRAGSVVTLNAIDILTEKLNELDGIAFERDAWMNQAPEQYGVVELAGPGNGQWADDHIIDESYHIAITLYVNGNDDIWATAVPEKLEELNDETDWFDIACSLTGRGYEYEINKVRWAFSVTLFGPLIKTKSPG